MPGSRRNEAVRNACAWTARIELRQTQTAQSAPDNVAVSAASRFKSKYNHVERGQAGALW